MPINWNNIDQDVRKKVEDERLVAEKEQRERMAVLDVVDKTLRRFVREFISVRDGLMERNVPAQLAFLYDDGKPEADKLWELLRGVPLVGLTLTSGATGAVVTLEENLMIFNPRKSQNNSKFFALHYNSVTGGATNETLEEKDLTEEVVATWLSRFARRAMGLPE